MILWRRTALKNIANRIICQQAIVAAVIATASYIALDANAAKSILYGSSIALTNALLLAWRMKQSARAQHLDAHKHLWSFYRSSLERFLIVVMLFAAGLGPLKLLPLAVIAGFALGQMTLIISQIMRGIKSN